MCRAFLIGDRIQLRPFQASDLHARLSWVNDREIQQLVGRKQPRGKGEEAAWLASRYERDNRLVLAIELKDSGQLIGYCGLAAIDYSNRKGVFAILIGEKDAWQRGFGPEATRLILSFAFDELNLHRVELEVYGNNPRAVRAYEKIGFRHEATCKESYYCNGAYHDHYVMAILRDEWQGRMQS